MNIQLKSAYHTLCVKENKNQSQLLTKLSALLEINHTSSDTFSQSLPFSINDITVGVENELQAIEFDETQSIEMQDGLEKKLFILDTNVILYDHTAIYHFDEHDIVIPIAEEVLRKSFSLLMKHKT